MSAPPTTSGGPLRTVRTRQRRLIAVCSKCSAKIGGGFGLGGKRSLAKALKRSEEIGKGKRAAVRVVETRCLGVCPKHAVALVDAERPAEVVIVPWGTPVELLLDHLGVTRATDPPG